MNSIELQRHAFECSNRVHRLRSAAQAATTKLRDSRTALAAAILRFQQMVPKRDIHREAALSAHREREAMTPQHIAQRRRTDAFARKRMTTGNSRGGLPLHVLQAAQNALLARSGQPT